MNQVEIFISYAHEDGKLARELLDHLRILEKQNPSGCIWSTGDILPGQEWEEAIREHLEEAKIILLLVSPNLLASKNNELSLIEAKQKAGKALVIPIILHPTDWSQTFFANIKPLPANGKPLSTWKSRNLAYEEIIDEVEEAIEEAIKSSKNSSTQIDKTVKMDFPKSVDQLLKYMEEQK